MKYAFDHSKPMNFGDLKITSKSVELSIQDFIVILVISKQLSNMH